MLSDGSISDFNLDQMLRILYLFFKVIRRFLESRRCAVALSNTFVRLIGKCAPLKRPASETTYFELLVLLFRVFEFQRSKDENSEEV